MMKIMKNIGSILAVFKKEIFDFFDNVIVNEDDETLRKNRLELIQYDV